MNGCGRLLCAGHRPPRQLAGRGEGVLSGFPFPANPQDGTQSCSNKPLHGPSTHDDLVPCHADHSSPCAAATLTPPKPTASQAKQLLPEAELN